MAARKSRTCQARTTMLADLVSLTVEVECPNGHRAILTAASLEVAGGCSCRGGGRGGWCDCESPYVAAGWYCGACKGAPATKTQGAVQPYYEVRVN